MISKNLIERPDTPLEAMFREWYTTDRNKEEIIKDMENFVFPEEIFIARMAELFEVFMKKAGYELRAAR